MKTQLLFLLVLVAVVTTAATVDKTVAKHNLVKVEPLEDRNGALVVYSSATEKLQFFLFDVEGRLVRNVEIVPPKKTIEGLHKGSYLFSVFKDDEEIEKGTVLIR